MTKLLVTVALALTAWSCAPKCQEFYTLSSDVHSTKLGLGSPQTLVVGSGEGPFDVTGALPPGMTLEVSGVRIRLTGTPTEVGSFQADVRPQSLACQNGGSSLGNIVLDFQVVPAECDNALACRLLKKSACTRSSGCPPTPPYTAAACIHAVGDAGVCVDVNGPGDQCSGAISAMTLTTVEGAQIESCVATPAITGCNFNVCYGLP
jgi:hypothetical protein